MEVFMLILNGKYIKYSICNFEPRINDGKRVIYNIDSKAELELDDKKEQIWNMLVRAAEGDDISDSLITQCISRTYKLPENTIMDTAFYVKNVIISLIENKFILVQ